MPDAVYLAQLLYMYARTHNDLYMTAFSDALENP